MEQLQIKTADQEQLKYIIKASQLEEWNPGLYDSQYYYHADPNGFFVGKIGNQIVCCIGGLKYQNGFGFIGYNVVKPEFRKRGYGSKMWDHCMEYLKGTQNIGLDAVVSMTDKYATKGFKYHNNTQRFEGTGLDEYQENKNIVPLKDLAFQSLLEYDKGMNPCYRPTFLKHYISMPDSLAVAYVIQDKIQGYMVVKKGVTGYKISPLFADSDEIANTLLLRARKFAGSNNLLYIDVPDSIEHAVKLIESHGFKKFFTCARMYTKGLPKIDENRIYGHTSFNIG